MGKLLKTAGVYVTLLATTIVDFWLLFRIRDLIIFLMEYFSVKPAVIGFYDKLILIIVGVALIVLTVFFESLYTKKGLYVFFVISGMQLFILQFIILIEDFLLHLRQPFLHLGDLLPIFVVGLLLTYVFCRYRDRVSKLK